jgi:hypothetical protein
MTSVRAWAGERERERESGRLVLDETPASVAEIQALLRGKSRLR